MDHHLICQHCEEEIKTPRDGKILRGHVHAARVDDSGQLSPELIGSPMPEEYFLFTSADIACDVYCNVCFLKLVGLDPFEEYFPGA